MGSITLPKNMYFLPGSRFFISSRERKLDSETVSKLDKGLFQNFLVTKIKLRKVDKIKKVLKSTVQILIFEPS